MIPPANRGHPPPNAQDPERRRFVKLGLAAAAGIFFPSSVFAAVNRTLSRTRRLAFHHVHTGEDLEIVYWANGSYLPDALDKINQLLRDHRTDEVRDMDPRLLDLLHALAVKLKSRNPFHVYSGYRSESTNALLWQQGRRVARHSLHVQGMAADVRLPDRSVSALKQAARTLESGGVGFYPRLRFVHLDVGPVRWW
jgi:uncharacterized protein YcbK (DUF882 family)